VLRVGGSKRINPALPLSQMRPWSRSVRTINRVARQSFLARYHLEANGIGRGARPDDTREAAAVGRHPDSALRRRPRAHRRCSRAELVGSAGSCRNTLTTVPSGRARSRPPSSVPSQTLPCAVLGNRRDARRADRAAALRTVGELADHARRGVEHVGAAVVHPEPDRAVARLENRLNADRAYAARIAGLDRNGFEPPVRPSSFLRPLAIVPIHSVS
jgi:hypothetical protein